jgi:hypothetical protein
MISRPYQVQERTFNDGYEACYEKLASIVKKLGKKYYKEFLLEVKKKDELFYTSYTTTTHPHKCNCDCVHASIK